VREGLFGEAISLREEIQVILSCSVSVTDFNLPEEEGLGRWAGCELTDTEVLGGKKFSCEKQGHRVKGQKQRR